MRKTGTSIACMDGRIQEPLREWVRVQYEVDYVDTITLPGIDRVVAENTNIDLVREMATLSVNAHKSPIVVVSGHHDCAGNSVSKEEHVEHIQKSVEVIKTWDLGVEVVGVWVNRDWHIKRVA